MFVLLPGAGGAGWIWHRVVDRLHDAGKEAVAIDLPASDEAAGLTEYAELVIGQITDPTATVLVAQSLGGFTAALVAARIPLKSLVFVNAMIPNPGETANDWWTNTGSSAARTAAAERHGYPTEFELFTYFLHDVPEAEIAAGEQHQQDEAEAAFAEPCAFTAYPHIPIHALAGADDRFFPVEFQQKLVRDRLGIEADVRPGGHLMPLSQPAAMAEYLLTIGAA